MGLISHIIGLDLGQVSDPTALSVLRRTTADNRQDPATYDCVMLHRFPLRTPYPEIVEAVAKMIDRPEMASKPGGKPILALDATGVGRPVVDLFLDRKLAATLHPISIHGGAEVGFETWRGPKGAIAQGFRVPKRDLVGIVQALLQTGRLKIVDALAEADVLRQELLKFRAKINIATGNESFEAHRERDHDDLVLATAMAAWIGERPRARLGAPSVVAIRDFPTSEPTEWSSVVGKLPFGY